MDEWWKPCKASVYGKHNEPNRTGHCTWCGRKVAGPPAKPSVIEESNLTLYYTYFYDPNWGSK